MIVFMSVAALWLGFAIYKLIVSTLQTKYKLVYCVCHGNTHHSNQSRIHVCMEKDHPPETMEVHATFVEAPWIKTLYITDLVYIRNIGNTLHVGKMKGFRRMPHHLQIVDEMKDHLAYNNKYDDWSVVLQWNMKRVLSRVARLYRKHELTNKKND